jgi:hypothetical protein
MYKAVSGPHFIATVHNDWSLWSFSYADLATLQYQATRQGQRPSDFWFGCYVDQFKPQLLLMEKKTQLVLVIFQIHGKNSTTNHPYG